MEKCSNTDKPEILEFLKRRSSDNGFMLGDAENFDLDGDFIDFWQHKEGEEMVCLLSRFYGYYQISAVKDCCFQEAADIILRDREAVSVSGLEAGMTKLGEFIRFRSIRRSYLAELSPERFRAESSPRLAQQVGEPDIDELFAFQKSIEEFGLTEKDRVDFEKEHRANKGCSFVIRENGEIVSSATISAENSRNGMLTGVATAAGYRNRGFARACVSALCQRMISAGKNVLLFYDNPAAAGLYRSLGFVDINRWMRGTLQGSV